MEDEQKRGERQKKGTRRKRQGRAGLAREQEVGRKKTCSY